MTDVVTADATLAAAKKAYEDAMAADNAAKVAAEEAALAPPTTTPAPVAATAPVAASPAPAPAGSPVASASAATPAAPAVVFGADGKPVGAPVALPVVVAGEFRVPDANDVVVNGVIVGRHSESKVRDEILAKAKEWFSKVKSL